VRSARGSLGFDLRCSYASRAGVSNERWGGNGRRRVPSAGEGTDGPEPVRKPAGFVECFCVLEWGMEAVRFE
jgi:hypothetical protein